ncbi:phage holin family protein [Mesobaculum littorinae]|uniref:Phage holin family protein n=1 Tax=Mesobaculum littorinae TaxID=2486419 RepID=A0A438AIC7_9RHOB|nr:phage holin family protein [Mesobaculum littorinae]RVV98388.1 phage holin family protein [Mesobaculum littorinae]
MNEQDPRSTTTLLSDAMVHVSGLVRKEIDLARAEADRSLRKVGTALGLIVSALLVILVALNVLVAAVVAGLAEVTDLNAGWSALIVGIVFMIIAFIMVRTGLSQLQSASLAPKRSVESVKQDAAAVKGAIK